MIKETRYIYFIYFFILLRLKEDLTHEMDQ